MSRTYFLKIFNFLVFDFFRDYFIFMSESKYREKYGEKQKIVSPKQMLQQIIMINK